jgi:multisubunit Na+/H+ antiporter MnhE subunit
MDFVLGFLLGLIATLFVRRWLVHRRFMNRKWREIDGLVDALRDNRLYYKDELWHG